MVKCFNIVLNIITSYFVVGLYYFDFNVLGAILYHIYRVLPLQRNIRIDQMYPL
jgi:hypothetical protein